MLSCCAAASGALLRQGGGGSLFLPRPLRRVSSAVRSGVSLGAFSRNSGCSARFLGGAAAGKGKASAAENGTGPVNEAEGPRSVSDGGSARRGAIHVIVGPMFAGKSTALLQRVQEESRGGRRVALVKSDKDTRYGPSAIVTHDGLQMPCYAVPNLATFKCIVGGEKYSEFEVIGIDEAQFFTDLHEFCLTAADFESKTLIVAGLDGDFLRRRFGSTLDLIPIADSVVKLSSRCEICGRPASFSFRKTLDTGTELVGGADIYMPVCRQHFVNGQIVVETASTVIGSQKVTQLSRD